MNLRAQISVLRTHVRLIVLGTLLAAGVALVASTLLPPTYQGETTLLVGRALTAVNTDYNQLLASQELSQTYAEVATTRPLMQRVIDRLGLATTPAELARRVSVDSPHASTIIHITVSDADAKRAAAIANAVADQLIAESPAIQGSAADVLAFVDESLHSTQQDIDQTSAQIKALVAVTGRTAAQEAQLAVLQDRLITLRNTYAQLLAYSSGSSPNLLSVIEPAVAPSAAASPRPVLDTFLAALLGLLVTVALAFLVNELDDTLKTPDDIEETVGLPTLGQVGRIRGHGRLADTQLMTTLRAPQSVVSEAFRTLRTNIDFASVDAPLRSILVTSARPGEGKTVVASNLAVVFAQSGRRVLLLDADLRRPGLHRMFRLPNARGLTDLLRNENASLEGVAVETIQPLLRVIPSGALPPNPAELLGSQRMQALLKRLTAEADLLIVDSPPLQVVTDAAILASRLEGTLLVIESGRARRGAVKHSREVLAAAGARVLGAVLNRLALQAQGDYIGYYSGALGPAAPELGLAGEGRPDHQARPG
jgi:non-specific protein-tyrosine kinase